ncbi:MAG TPA: phytoene/squalene synthase family protein [Bacteroidales bacterium]|nr:phytoene/squalene synthase family protein [Bacteroidales bacterium]
MQKLFRDISFKTSRLVTKSYSTSFSIAVSYLDRDIGEAIYSIYGFVRFADEIVDTFHDYDRDTLLTRFERDYDEAISTGLSLNPVLNSFQETVKKFNIPDDLVRSFLKSMRADLVKSDYMSREETDEYIYGSAEVVGLMCLMVFVNGSKSLYEELREPARRLGAAFQKVNFIRDIKNDVELLDRKYFHHTVGREFTEEVKKVIIDEIYDDFRQSWKGIRRLPQGSRTGVLIAYYYYLALLRKIEKTPAAKQFENRIRIPDYIKFLILGKAVMKNKLRLV